MIKLARYVLYDILRSKVIIGYTLFLLLPIPDSHPEMAVKFYNISGGKLFELGRSFWLTTEGGLSWVKGEELRFSRQAEVSDGWFYTSSNYAIAKEEKTGVGALLKADITWAFSSFAGLGIGAYAQVNGIQSPVGGEFKLIIGWMNRKPKK